MKTADPTTPRPRSPLRQSVKTRARPLLLALFFAAVGFGFFTRQNTFPFFYHTDEPAKVRQVLDGWHNFHHPLLLLQATEFTMKIAHTPHSPQATVEVGRTVSAVFGSIAIAAFVLLAWQRGGAVAAIVSGALLVTQPLFFELAHYMKEDCALLAGVALCFLAMSHYAQRPSLALAILAGAAGGLATSGKYIGGAVAALAVVQIVCTKTREAGCGWKHALAALPAAALVFSLINLETLLHPSAAHTGLSDNFVAIEQAAVRKGGGIQVKYLGQFGRAISFPILAATAFWAWRRWRNRRSESFFTWMLLAFPFVFLLVLGVVPQTKERYLLPSLAFFSVLGGLGVAELFHWKPWAPTVAAVLGAAAVACHLPSLIDCYRAFSTDDRRDMIAWMRANLPADATILHGNRVKLDEARKLDDPAFGFPQKILTPERSAAEFGPLSVLAAKGVRYVVVCQADYSEAFARSKHPKRAAVVNKRFYEELFAKGKLLWERPLARISYLHPGLRIYELPDRGVGAR